VALGKNIDMDQIDHMVLEGCFKIIYECLKQKWPHHISYEPIISLCKRSG